MFIAIYCYSFKRSWCDRPDFLFDWSGYINYSLSQYTLTTPLKCDRGHVQVFLYCCVTPCLIIDSLIHMQPFSQVFKMHAVGHACSKYTVIGF